MSSAADKQQGTLAVDEDTSLDCACTQKGMSDMHRRTEALYLSFFPLDAWGLCAWLVPASRSCDGKLTNTTYDKYDISSMLFPTPSLPVPLTGQKVVNHHKFAQALGCSRTNVMGAYLGKHTDLSHRQSIPGPAPQGAHTHTFPAAQLGSRPPPRHTLGVLSPGRPHASAHLCARFVTY